MLIKEVSFYDYKEKILSLRQRMWEQTDPTLMKQVFGNGFSDEHDSAGIHWVALDENNSVVACARLSKHLTVDDLPDRHMMISASLPCLKLPIASMNRLCVEKEYQRQGLSKKFDKVRLAKAKAIGCRSICAMTYGSREKQLRQSGFKPFRIIRRDFKSDKLSNQYNAPAFFYKILDEASVTTVSDAASKKVLL